MKWAPGVAAILAAAALAAAAPHDPARSPSGVTARIDRSGDARPCSGVRVHGIDASGGCDLEVSSSKTRFTAVTPFGDRPLSECALTYQMRLGGNGELAITDVVLTPVGTASAICGDIVPCVRRPEQLQDIEKLAWAGRLAAEKGSLHADVDACFDTCFGRFEGTVRLDVSRTADGLRLRADDAALGVSGLELSGSWTLRPYYGGKLRLG